MLKVVFFPDGNTMALRDGQQAPDLQESWFMLYVQLLVAAGIDPREVEFSMPGGGSKAAVFKVESGYNWKLVHEGTYGKF